MLAGRGVPGMVGGGDQLDGSTHRNCWLPPRLSRDDLPCRWASTKEYWRTNSQVFPHGFFLPIMSVFLIFSMSGMVILSRGLYRSVGWDGFVQQWCTPKTEGFPDNSYYWMLSRYQHFLDKPIWLLVIQQFRDESNWPEHIIQLTLVVYCNASHNSENAQQNRNDLTRDCNDR